MLEHLRQRIIAALQEQSTVMLATSGPAGLEISPCEARLDGLKLILLIPATSEHLVNIETNPTVAITQDHWRLTGAATLPCDGLRSDTGRTWLTALTIIPSRFEFLTHDTHQVAETIDISPDD